MKLLDKLKDVAGTIGYYVVIPVLGVVMTVNDAIREKRRKRVHPSGERFKAGDRVVDEYGNIIE